MTDRKYAVFRYPPDAGPARFVEICAAASPAAAVAAQPRHGQFHVYEVLDEGVFTKRLCTTYEIEQKTKLGETEEAVEDG